MIKRGNIIFLVLIINLIILSGNSSASCEESDGGNDPINPGSTGQCIFGCDIKNDACTSTTDIREYYCNGQFRDSVTGSCPSSHPRCVTNGAASQCVECTQESHCGAAEDCVNNECIPAPICYDSDGEDYVNTAPGQNGVSSPPDSTKNTGGYVNTDDGDIPDSCTSNSLGVNEAYCSATLGIPNTVSLTCANTHKCFDPSGNLNGAFCRLKCIDTDDTEPIENPSVGSYATPGSVTAQGSSGGNSITYPDSCSSTNPNLLYEYYCMDEFTQSFNSVNCPNGCSNGECLDAPPVCTDSDGDGYSPQGATCGQVDCDDGLASVNPGASEVCGNSRDDDCDGSLNEGCGTNSCIDRDFSGDSIEDGEESLKTPERARNSGIGQSEFDWCESNPGGNFPNFIVEAYCAGSIPDTSRARCPTNYPYCINKTGSYWYSIGMSANSYGSNQLVAACVQCTQNSTMANPNPAECASMGNGYFCNSTFGCQALSTTCGNGDIDLGEQCDTGNLGGATCITQGFSGGGTLGCTSSCTFNTTLCVSGGDVCGDGSITGTELCDIGPDTVGGTEDDEVNQDCTDISGGFDSGDLRCGNSCSSYNTTLCRDDVVPDDCDMNKTTTNIFESPAECFDIDNLKDVSGNQLTNQRKKELCNSQCPFTEVNDPYTCRWNDATNKCDQIDLSTNCVIEYIDAGSCESGDTSREIRIIDSCDSECSAPNGCPKEIPCPRVIALPFFGVFGFILSMAVIMIIYLLLVRKYKIRIE